MLEVQRMLGSATMRLPGAYAQCPCAIAHGPPVLHATALFVSSSCAGPAARLAVSPTCGTDFEDIFLSMFSGDMQEGRTAEMEVKETVREAVELLLTHMYGDEVEVPLSLALQLHALPDRYQLKSDLTQQQRWWLGTVRMEPVALFELLPAAHTVCRRVCEASWYSQAAAAAGESKSFAALGSWQIDVVQSIMQHVSPAAAFRLAVGWVEAPLQPAAAPSCGVSGDATVIRGMFGLMHC